MPVYDTQATKRPVNQTMNGDVVEKARAKGLNLSALAEKAVTAELARSAREQCDAEIAEACAAHERYLEEYGVRQRPASGASGGRERASWHQIVHVVTVLCLWRGSTLPDCLAAPRCFLGHLNHCFADITATRRLRQRDAAGGCRRNQLPGLPARSGGVSILGVGRNRGNCFPFCRRRRTFAPTVRPAGFPARGAAPGRTAVPACFGAIEYHRRTEPIRCAAARRSRVP